MDCLIQAYAIYGRSSKSDCQKSIHFLGTCDSWALKQLRFQKVSQKHEVFRKVFQNSSYYTFWIYVIHGRSSNSDCQTVSQNHKVFSKLFNEDAALYVLSICDSWRFSNSDSDFPKSNSDIPTFWYYKAFQLTVKSIFCVDFSVAANDMFDFFFFSSWRFQLFIKILSEKLMFLVCFLAMWITWAQKHMC